MQTRMKLWKDYRQEINDNMGLQKSVEKSNEQLRVLYNRLLNAYPKYKDKYPIETIQVSTKAKEVESAPRFLNDEIVSIISDINKIGSKNNSLASIDDYDFSSHELDDVMRAFKIKRTSSKKYKSIAKSVDIQLNDLQSLSLSTKERRNMDKTNKLIKKINVAIDGPSGSGKSTIAKAIAEKYDLIYINTGLVYRAIALHATEEGTDFNSVEDIISSLKTLKVELLENEQVILNDLNVSKEVRSDDISQKASIVAVIPEVRIKALEIQQYYGSQEGTIMDGRDTTFKIMPNADIKIFLDTTPEVRAQRRVDQNKELGFSDNYDNILKEIQERDNRDKNRKTDPLHKVKDAILIDASTLSIEDVIQKVSNLIDNI